MTYIPLDKAPQEYLATLAAFIGGAVLVILLLSVLFYFFVVRRDGEKLSGPARKIHDFLNFRNSNVREAIKFFYLFATLLVVFCCISTLVTAAEFTVTAVIPVLCMAAMSCLLIRFGCQCLMVFVETRDTNRQILQQMRQHRPQSNDRRNSKPDITEAAKVAVKKEEKATITKEKKTKPKREEKAKSPAKTENKPKTNAEKPAEQENIPKPRRRRRRKSTNSQPQS